jgi:signal transduction histidine kinase
MTVISVAMIIVMALLVYWSQGQLATANKAKNLADEIVSSVFERNTLKNEYIGNNDRRARDLWLSKQNHISGLLRKTPTGTVSLSDRDTVSAIRKNLEGSSAVFQQIMHNRDSSGNGQGLPGRPDGIEHRLDEQLTLVFMNTIADAHRLQKSANEMIATTQRTTAWVSLSILVAVSLFVIIVAWSLVHIVNRGIKSLQLGAAAIGAGNIHHTITIESDDEFAVVAVAFNTMSGKLAESHAALERDIIARKRSAVEIEGLNRDLNHTVSQLLGANQELDSFAYSVSHDLRAPLRAMGGFSEALVEDFGDTLAAEARDYLNEIIIGSRHMGHLIDGLLTLSRSTRGELRRDLVDLSQMADRIRSELERMEPLRLVEWRIEPGLCACGDAGMIELVMRNLLDNAWKYTAGTAEPTIRVFAETGAGELMYCVKDNGAGFEMAHAGKLFQPFQRLHRQDEFPGIGIGLATAQRIVHRHGGTIQASGMPRGGAIFRFSLPYVEEQSMGEP